MFHVTSFHHFPNIFQPLRHVRRRHHPLGVRTEGPRGQAALPSVPVNGDIPGIMGMISRILFKFNCYVIYLAGEYYKDETTNHHRPGKVYLFWQGESEAAVAWWNPHETQLNRKESPIGLSHLIKNGFPFRWLLILIYFVDRFAFLWVIYDIYIYTYTCHIWPGMIGSHWPNGILESTRVSCGGFQNHGPMGGVAPNHPVVMNDHGPQDRPHLLMWLAYCYFHNGDYKKAIDAYDDATRKAGGCWVLDGAPNYLV